MLLDMLDTDVWCYTVSEGITTLLMYGLSKPWTCDCPASVSGILGVVCQHIWLFTISSFDILILCIATTLSVGVMGL